MTTRYLLFAGQHHTGGGLSDLKGVFDDEAAARSAFTAERLRFTDAAAWAELGSVDAAGNWAVLCWFGHERPAASRRRRPAPTLGTSIDADAAPHPGRPRWRRRRRSGRGPAGVVTVAVARAGVPFPRYAGRR